MSFLDNAGFIDCVVPENNVVGGFGIVVNFFKPFYALTRNGFSQELCTCMISFSLCNILFPAH